MSFKPWQLARPILDFFQPDTRTGRKRVFALLLATAGALTAGGVVLGVRDVPASTLVVPIVAAGLLLEPSQVRVLIIGSIGCLGALIGFDGLESVRPVAGVLVIIVAVIANALATDRQRLGLSVGRGDSMLIELRDSLELQGEPPSLPDDWQVEVARRPAGGGTFGGDFLVTALTCDGTGLELALVDVSGKGPDAGTRSLLLSGAFGALLGSVPPKQFLEAANSYVLRQHWAEGFATCVHIAITLATGELQINYAGHPPAVQFSAGSGKWSILESSGTALGLYEDATFGSVDAELRPGDALVLYTDGVVEMPGRDLELGIDRLIGATERMLARGFEGGAEQLIETASSGINDDRALVLLWRR